MYVHERNYGCRASDEYTYRGLKALIMENEYLRVGILADKGTDIYEFLYKPLDIDFLWRSYNGVRNPSLAVRTNEGSMGAFIDYYEGGWQEIFPSGGAGSAPYKGAEFGLHGEVSNIPWRCQIVVDTPEEVRVKFWVRTYRTPFYLEKTLTLTAKSPLLRIDEKVTNEGGEEMEFMWGHHPAFGIPLLDGNCVIDAPAKTIVIHPAETASTNRFPRNAKFKWPMAKDLKGQEVDVSKIPPPEAKWADMAYLTDLEEGWYALTNSAKKIGFGMRWDAKVFPCIWYWMVFGGGYGHPWFGATYNMALEPFSSYPGTGLAEAVKSGRALKLGPGQSLSTSLLAVAYTGLSTVKGIDEKGKVHG
jgi:galactose mutarotase-like enzyme